MTAIQARPLPRRGDALPVALSDLAASMNWSPPSAPSRAVESPLGRVGRLFFEASRAIVPEADRRQARLLASLNFLLIFVYAGGEIAASMYAPEKISPSILPVLACSGLLSVAAYGFSRTRHIGAAIIVSLSVQWITPLAAMLADAATESVGIFRTSAWLALSMLLAIGTATLRAAVVLAVAALVLPVVGALLHLPAAATLQAVPPSPLQVHEIDEEAFAASRGGRSASLARDHARPAPDPPPLP